MGDDNNEMPDGVAEFLRLFEEARKKMAAVECFSELIQYVSRDEFSEEEGSESMDGVVEILIRYAEKEIMHNMSKGV